MRCYNCDRSGHMAQECCLPQRNGSGNSKEKRDGDRDGNSDLGKITSAINGMRTEFASMKSSISSLVERVKNAGF